MKRVTLGFLAFVLAIGITLANSSASQNAWIRISLLGSDSFICANSGFECDESGVAVCKIDVLTISGIVTVTGKRQLSCVATINNSSNTPVGFYFPSFGLIQSAE